MISLKPGTGPAVSPNGPVLLATRDSLTILSPSRDRVGTFDITSMHVISTAQAAAFAAQAAVDQKGAADAAAEASHAGIDGSPGATWPVPDQRPRTLVEPSAAGSAMQALHAYRATHRDRASSKPMASPARRS